MRPGALGVLGFVGGVFLLTGYMAGVTVLVQAGWFLLTVLFGLCFALLLQVRRQLRRNRWRS